MLRTPLSCLIPLPYDPQWTRLDDGTFNDYPYPAPALDTPAGQLNLQRTLARGGVPAPFGTIPWANPTSAVIIGLNATSPTTVPVLPENRKRNLLVIQNNSTATSPDVAPTLWIGFGRAAVANFSLGLAPGNNIGLVLDIIVPRDTVYILFTGATGVTAVTAGMLLQGSHDDNM